MDLIHSDAKRWQQVSGYGSLQSSGAKLPDGVQRIPQMIIVPGLGFVLGKERPQHRFLRRKRLHAIQRTDPLGQACHHPRHGLSMGGAHPTGIEGQVAVNDGDKPHLLDQRLQDWARSDVLLDEFIHLGHFPLLCSQTRGKVT